MIDVTPLKKNLLQFCTLSFISLLNTNCIKVKNAIPVNCYHCGEQCDDIIAMDSKTFCCEGCKQVYLLLNENNLCTYYDFDKNPGIKAKGKFVCERFAYLDDDATAKKLVQFSSDTQTNVTFSVTTNALFLLYFFAGKPAPD